MSVIEVGRVCVKIAGRDAGERCVITKVIDGNQVMVKNTGRKKERKCAVKHLEPTPKTVDVKDAAAVEKVFK